MPSASSYEDVVQSLYVAYFGKPADPTGLTNFETALAAADTPGTATTLTGLQAAYSTNAAIAALVDSFGTSAASISLYGEVTTASSAQSFLNTIFENSFNHRSTAGLTFYINSIVSGGMSLGNAALQITASAGTVDAATLAAKVAFFTGGMTLSGGTLELQNPSAAGSGPITFLNGTSSTLQIDGTTMPANQITGFAAGDTIDLRNIVADSASYSGGVLTLQSGSTTVAQLNLGTVHPAGNDFRMASDGLGGTQIGLVPPVADFNGDGDSDLLFQNTDGTPAIWTMSSTTSISQVALSNPSSFWHLVGTGDVNGDGMSDLIWQAADGTPAIWEMNGTTPTNEVALSNPSSFWHLVGTGDFNGDGKSDLVWQASDGTPAIWLMNGTTPTTEVALSNPGPSWHLVGTGDFNGDGMSDLLWQNNDGTPAIWLMNGTTPTFQTGLFNPGPSWHLIGTGDFNGDGKSDLLWQNDDGTPAIWLMNGTTLTSAVALFDPGPSWHVIGAEDLNGDGKSDIIFQNDDGMPGVWLMNGATPTFQTGLFDPGPSWRLLPGL